ncbi:SUMF1/EgtB/PvdO family nonheme iron enzyme [bacterium]|nr:SUMF1/EgtB/PvdO family nonheme iron enzyme [bacterium]
MKANFYKWMVIGVGCLLIPLSSFTAQEKPQPDKAYTYIQSFRFEPLKQAINDMTLRFGNEYPKGKAYLQQCKRLKSQSASLTAMSKTKQDRNTSQLIALARELRQFKREALLANPLLSFDTLLVVKRAINKRHNYSKKRGLGFPSNHECNSSLPRDGYDNEIAALSPVSPQGELKTVYRPSESGYVGQMDLHWDADRLLFTQSDKTNWKLWEMQPDGGDLRQVSKMPDDVDAMDACYLPDGRIAFGSTAAYQSVPCWHGQKWVSNLYVMNADGSGVRQLCYDQDHDYHPSVLDNGQIIYTRWDYTGISHIFFRQLMVMNPDGTGQRAVYGSNSWYPNSLFHARQIPGRPGEYITILSGYHGVPKMGQLAIVNTKQGMHGQEGLAVRISGKGEPFEPRIRDALVNGDWPKFVHPYPLDENYFLVSCWENTNSNWAIYLADRFDNLTLLCEDPNYELLEPVPVIKRDTPPMIPSKIQPEKEEGIVYLQDVYYGPGLKGVPKGSIKELRVLAYHFGYRHMAGPHKIGYGGPWEAMRILGTVPLEEDGSAIFNVPANTPVAVQPLDEEGKAVQQMRSWFTVMPGEVRSCAGCHEKQSDLPQVKKTIAALKQPRAITPWYGPARGFDFEREMQPVLDAYCVECHNGSKKDIPDLRAEKHSPNYKGKRMSTLGDRRLHPQIKKITGNLWKFTPAYDALLPYLRRVSIEDDVSLLEPGEYHADSSELVQMLQKGHKGVELDEESWDRLITWIDLNAPCHGTWNDAWSVPEGSDARRMELRKKYGGPYYDPEAIPDIPKPNIQPNPRKPISKPKIVKSDAFPFDAAEAKAKQRKEDEILKKIELGDGQTLELMKVPAGTFVMGDAKGRPDEYPLSEVKVQDAFWMGKYEITNAQYRLFDPRHESRYYNKRHARADDKGRPLDGPNQPVVRVSWEDAMAFCDWLSRKTGMTFTLPSEAQWEYACRAGSERPLFYGGIKEDFTLWGNMADKEFSEGKQKNGLQITGGVEHIALEGAELALAQYNDGVIVTADVGSFKPNPFGLFDMHGNAAEWTCSRYQPYPYKDEDGRNQRDGGGHKTVRGGSFFDRPERCRSGFRLPYPHWQRIFNVGFRVVASEAQPRKISQVK